MGVKEVAAVAAALEVQLLDVIEQRNNKS